MMTTAASRLDSSGEGAALRHKAMHEFSITVDAQDFRGTPKKVADLIVDRGRQAEGSKRSEDNKGKEKKTKKGKKETETTTSKKTTKKGELKRQGEGEGKDEEDHRINNYKKSKKSEKTN